MTNRSPFLQTRTDGGVGQKLIVDGRLAPHDVFFVQSTHANAGDSAGKGQTPDAPFSTIDYAVGQCSASKGDLIVVLPGHVETVIAAGGLDLDVAGITILGVGEGTLRPKISFTTVDTADADVDAANVTLVNLVFECNIDGQDVMLDVNSDDLRLLNCEFREGASAQPDVALDIAGAGANACDRIKVERCRFFFPSAGPTHAIKLTNVHDGIEIVDSFLHGDFATAAIGSGAALTNLLIARNVVSNLNAGDFCIELTAAATGMCIDNRLFADTPSTTLDPGSLKCTGNLAVNDIDEAGQPVPFLLRDLPSNYFTVTADFESSTWNTASSHEIATVTGMVRLVILPQVTETITSSGGTATLVLGDETTSNSLIASTDAEALAAGEFWLDATPTDTVCLKSQLNALDFLIQSGKDVGFTIGTEALTDGTIVFHVWWEPLSTDGHVAAGAGGAL